MPGEIIETDLDFLLDLVQDFGLQSSDTIADLIEALEQEEAAFDSSDGDDDD